MTAHVWCWLEPSDEVGDMNGSWDRRKRSGWKAWKWRLDRGSGMARNKLRTLTGVWDSSDTRMDGALTCWRNDCSWICQKAKHHLRMPQNDASTYSSFLHLTSPPLLLSLKDQRESILIRKPLSKSYSFVPREQHHCGESTGVTCVRRQTGDSEKRLQVWS